MLSESKPETGYVPLGDDDESVKDGSSAGSKKRSWTIAWFIAAALALGSLLAVVVLSGTFSQGSSSLRSQAATATGREESSQVTPLPDRGGPISFQAHSFNDLRQWRSLYLKGARSFKLDSHFVKGDGTWRNRTRIVFTHNYPLTETKIAYDGFDDLFRELGPGGALGSLLREDDERIRIQLCFKSGPTLSCNSSNPHRKSHEETAWIDIIDGFYDRVESSDFHSSHVEFLLDGAGKPSGCLRNKWRKWKSVWISNDSGSPSSALTSAEQNDKADNSRFVVLNDPLGFASWQRLAAIGYGRFSTLPYPYQLWEPDDQKEIHRYVDLFKGSSPGHSEGFVFVSNSDPVMISLYAGAHSAFNRPVLIDAAIKCPIGIYATASLIVAMYRYDGANGTAAPELRTSVFSRKLGLPVVHRPLYDSVVPSSRPYSRFVAHERASHAVLSDVDGVFSKVYIRPVDGQFSVVLSEIQAPQPWLWMNTSASFFNPIQTKCLGVKGFVRAEGMMEEYVALWSMTYPKNSSAPLPDDGNNDFAICSLMAVRFTIATTTKQSVNETVIGNYACLVRDPKLTPLDGDVVRLEKETFGVVFSDASKQVYSAIFAGGRNRTSTSSSSADDAEDQQMTTTTSTGGGSEAKIIGAGTAPRFSASFNMDMKDDLIALVMGDSFCSNNQEYNKRAGPTMLCDTKPVSHKGVMTYTLGSSKAWIELFRRPGKTLNACDSNLLHGAYDVGQCPHVTLVVANALKGEAEMLSLHRSIDDPKGFDKSCAIPKWDKSLVLNSVPLFYEPRFFSHDKRHGVRVLQR